MGMNVARLQMTKAFSRSFDGTILDAAHIEVSRIWEGNLCRSVVTNRGDQPLRLREIVLFADASNLTPSTTFYGEAYQTLSQTIGTLAAPQDVSRYSDHSHYKMQQTPGMVTAYNAVVLSERPDAHVLLGFTSCRRFSGTFRLSPEHFEIALDMEG